MVAVVKVSLIILMKICDVPQNPVEHGRVSDDIANTEPVDLDSPRD
jgi:hypothetical protein